MMSQGLLERMFARSEGNPLYTEELLAAVGWPGSRSPVVVVGHQPTLGLAVSRLLAGAERIGVDESALRERAVIDPAATVIADVERLRSARAISPRVRISGHVYDVVTAADDADPDDALTVDDDFDPDEMDEAEYEDEADGNEARYTPRSKALPHTGI